MIKVALRIVTDLLIVVLIIGLYISWQNSENKQYAKCFSDLKRLDIARTNINKIASIIIEDASISAQKMQLSKKCNKYEFLFLIEEMANVCNSELLIIHDIKASILSENYVITLISYEGLPMRKFIVYSENILFDIQAKRYYSFYIGMKIKGWFKEIPTSKN